jgi:hypothetical protein
MIELKRRLLPEAAFFCLRPFFDFRSRADGPQQADFFQP